MVRDKRDIGSVTVELSRPECLRVDEIASKIEGKQANSKPSFNRILLYRLLQGEVAHI